LGEGRALKAASNRESDQRMAHGSVHDFVS